MSKLTRFTQKLFGSSAGNNQIAKFGSLAAGSPTSYSGATVTPDNIQALDNFLQGWYGAAIGVNSPAIEDMNALFYLYGYQLSYLMQEGIPEYDAGTTYFTGGLVNDGTGIIYKSLQDNNLNNPLTSGSWWIPASAAKIITTGSAITVTMASTGARIYANSTGSAFTVTLPAAVTGPYSFTITKTSSDNNSITVTDGTFSTTLDLQDQSVTVSSDGTTCRVVDKYVPTLACRYTKVAAQSVTLSVGAIVNYDNLEYDTFNCVTTGSAWVFTAKVAGYYDVAAQLRISSLSTSTQAFLTFYKNGSAYAVNLLVDRADANSVAEGNVSTSLHLNKGDTLYVWVDGVNDAGGADIDTIPQSAFVNITLLAPG